MRNAVVFTIALLIASHSLLADTVILNDGTKLEGDVKKTDKGWTIVTTDGKTIEVAAEKVKSIQLGKDATKGTPERAMSDLLSLRRSVENLSDVNLVIERFNRFIETERRDSPARRRGARRIWRSRRDRRRIADL